MNSARHPEHPFKIGRFVSEYAPGGFSRVLTYRGVPSLNEIFKPTGAAEFVPDWPASRDRARKAIQLYDVSMNSTLGNLDVLCIRENVYTKPADIPRDEMEALRIMKLELGIKTPDEEPFGSEYGMYFPKGVRVVAAIAGRADFMGPNFPCTYLGIQQTAESLDWYRQGLEIVLETCEWVLEYGDGDSESFRLRWSMK